MSFRGWMIGPHLYLSKMPTDTYIFNIGVKIYFINICHKIQQPAVFVCIIFTSIMTKVNDGPIDKKQAFYHLSIIIIRHLGDSYIYKDFFNTEMIFVLLYCDHCGSVCYFRMSLVNA